MSEGWIKLHRQIQEHDFWKKEIFSRGQAWIDLLLLANHKNGYIRVRGIRIEVGRGKIGWSIISLAHRWHWSRGKAKRFLDELETDQQIVQQGNTVSSLIIVVNYNKYQFDSTADGTADGQQTVQQTDTNKNNKNEKNTSIKELVVIKPRESVVASSDATPAQILRDFFTNEASRETMVQEWLAKGMSEEIIRREVKKFCSYWTERNKTGTKERWELMKTFELRRRLVTWMRNSFNFSPRSV